MGTASLAHAKSFIDYIKPTPTVAALSSATWGVAGVLPRDISNGIEDAKGAGVSPGWFYWDGQIIRAKDGKYHMFMSTWEPGTVGFQRWSSSDAFHAISDTNVLGPYKRQDYVYSNNGSHKGHNVSAAEMPDGTYVVVVSEIVMFTIYKSASLDGPWTACGGGELIQPNGIKTSSSTTCPAGGACNDSHWDSNVSLTARHDGKYEIVQRHGFIAIADTLCGPYKMQKPTWDYPTANLPNVDSIYPKRTSNPVVSNPSYGWEEDPHIWYSGGTYHVIYSGSGDRVGWHLYSPDGINHWKDDGLAYTPREAQKMFTYEGSTTATQWYKCERPGVVLQNGHPTHITLAVSDVDKDNQIPAGSNHGSKVLVIPFDGEAFDKDYGNGAAGGSGGSSGTAGSTGSAGSSGTGGARGGSTATGGNSSSAVSSSSSAGSGGRASSGGSTATSSSSATSTASGGMGGGSSSPLGGAGAGGSVTTSAAAGSSSRASSSASSAGSSSPGSSASGGASSSSPPTTATGGSSGRSTDSSQASTASGGDDGGCNCAFGAGRHRGAVLPGLLLGILGFLLTRRRPR
jgi:hypothetical protein